MKKFLSTIFYFSLILFWDSVFLIELYSDENIIQHPALSEDISNVNNESDNGSDQTDKSKNINLDMQALYGIQYNQMFSGFSLSQERDTFVYLLSTKFDRSGDFGYNDQTFINSGFNENTVGLTINWNLTDIKLIIDGEADNESRGMFNNDVYSREEKGNNKISSKTIYKFSPSTEVFFLIGGAWYKHNLIAIDPSKLEKSRVLQSNFEIGGEYVWSASNRMRLNADLLYYDYKPEEVENDRHLKSEIIDDFNITRNIGISIGFGYVNNKDDEDIKFPYYIPFNASLSFKGYKYLNSIFIYKYDIIPFQPEEFYLKQKYVNPAYDLPPSIVHTGEARIDSKLNSFLDLKASFKIEKNNNFYNYFPIIEGNVLTADTIGVISYNPGIETNLSLYKKIWELAFSYNYFYFNAEKNITYDSNHEASNSIRYNGENWKFEWSNTLRGKVYTDPDSDEKLPEAFIGSLGIQRRVLEGSYFYCKIENLYNNKYVLRKGYPEPGISFLGGLRLLI